jgi:hypothetical protein
MYKIKLLIISMLLNTTVVLAQNADIYRFQEGKTTRWASFENPDAEKGKGGIVGKGAKGYPYHVLMPGESVNLLDIKGAGVINRIWLTADDLFHIPDEHRSMKIEMFWDGSQKPAVSAPLEDFFNQVFGQMVAFDNHLFSSPEARSFMSYVQMPFRKGAKILITNESENYTHRIFYDINMTMVEKHDDNVMYFHAYWRRDKATQPGVDFEISPKLKGKGRFLGTNIGVIDFHRYSGWWGEGEVKIYLDGDDEHPTLIGSGTEDYIGSGWEQGVFHTKYMGSSIANDNGRHAFYRFHIIDPVYFNEDVRVTIQQMGGTLKDDLIKMKEQGLPIIPVSFIDGNKRQLNFLMGMPDLMMINMGEEPGQIITGKMMCALPAIFI